MKEEAVKTIGIVEVFAVLLLVVGFTLLIREYIKWNKDRKIFDKIKDNSFDFSPKYYKDNKHALGIYIVAYVTYGHNIKTDMSEKEFRGKLIRFIGKYAKTDKDKFKSLEFMLDLICTSIRKCIKCGEMNFGMRARYLMKKIEAEYADVISTNDGDIADFINEIQMLLSESDDNKNI